jgi:hypothetical protein
MSMREALAPCVGKNITIIMSGINIAMTGTLLAVSDGWFVLNTKNSPSQYFDMSKMCSFWVQDD